MSPGLFAAVFLVVAVVNLAVLVIGGLRAERRFRGGEGQRVVFRERFASGFSNRSPLTKMGGARSTLDVVVTERELWLKGILLPFSFVGSRFDLTHRVPLSSIRRVERQGRSVEMRFDNEAGGESRVELRLRDPTGFTSAIDRHSRSSRNGASLE